MTSLINAYLSLGSNLGNRCEHLKNAKDKIQEQIGEIIGESSVYENPPNGFQAETDFLNMCIKVSTQKSPFELLHALKSIETELGRVNPTSNGYASRCIDIDIIFFGERIIVSEQLIIPHTKFRERNFVLVPLNELSPNTIDPITHLTIALLLENSLDEFNMKEHNCE